MASLGSSQSADPSRVSPPGATAQSSALDDLFTVAYEELRRLAATVSRDERSVTLSPTAIVNEAWIKLSRTAAHGFESPLHFRRVAARAMRQVLVESARRRNASRRGADALFVTFDGDAASVASTASDLLALDDALGELARLNPRQAAMVEARFFGGLETSEIAEVLAVSEATVLRDWRAARAWLAAELRAS